MRTWLLILLVIVSTAAIAQQKTPVGDFTKSPTEHIINQIEQPFVARSVTGMISRETTGAIEPLKNVLFEIQGHGTDGKIRRATSDMNGQFKIANVPTGTYKFKATLNGFQSVMGTIIVSKEAPKASQINIAMHIGV
jgi:hypothetical protein